MKKMTLLAFALTFVISIAGANSPNECCGQSNDTTFNLDYDAFRKVRDQLIGKWQNTAYTADLGGSDESGAYLRYEFLPNGSFIKTMGAGQMTYEERGQWELNNDGKRLMLYPDGCLSPEVIAVKYLELDELVMEQFVQSQEDDSETEVKDVFYNRL